MSIGRTLPKPNAQAEARIKTLESQLSPEALSKFDRPFEGKKVTIGKVGPSRALTTQEQVFNEKFGKFGAFGKHISELEKAVNEKQAQTKQETTARKRTVFAGAKQRENIFRRTLGGR